MSAGADQKLKQLYEFSPFRVDPEKELLLRGETFPVGYQPNVLGKGGRPRNGPS
jgi:hypothetical protein